MLRADGIAGRLSDTRLVLGRDSDARRPKSVQILPDNVPDVQKSPENVPLSELRSASLLASRAKARGEAEIRRLLRLASELIDAEGHHAHATPSHDERVLGKIGKSLELGAEHIEATVAHEARHEDRIDPLVDKRRHVAQKQLRCKAALIDGKTVARFERAATRRRIEHDLEPKLCKEGSPRYAVAVAQKRARNADAPDIGRSARWPNSSLAVSSQRNSQSAIVRPTNCLVKNILTFRR